MTAARKFIIMEKCLERTRSQNGITSQVIVDIILWLAVGVPVLYIYVSGVPFERGFHCDDTSLMHPYKKESVSTPVLLIAGFGISIATILLVETLNSVDRRFKRVGRARDNISYCVTAYALFLLGFVILQLMLEVVKHQLGFLRPNFFDVCRPQFNTSLCPGFISEYTCTSTNHGPDEIRDSRLSFPSGHAGLAMYIAAFFSIYVHKRLQIGFSNILKLLIQTGLVFIAIMCGVGRIRDNKHHPSDVIGGFLLGIAVALAIYKTVGQRFLVSSRVKVRNNSTIRTINKTDFCCTCANTSEPQTPAPLLPNEYPQNGSNGVTSSPTLKEFSFKARRHMSAPVTTAINGPENV